MPDFDAREFARLARELSTEADEAMTFATVVARAVDVVPGCAFAGVTLRMRRGRLATVAYTDPVVLECDQLQRRIGEGPCMESARADTTAYVVGDLEHDERWPTWGSKVAGLGIGSLVAAQLTDDTSSLGVLTMYGEGPRAFDARAIDRALTYAVLATSAMHSAHLVSGLQHALESRHTIGMAQGILMHAYQMGPEPAFDLLRRYSMNLNLPMRELSAIVVDRGGLPSEDVGSDPRHGHGAAPSA